MPRDVFICYSHEDQAIADTVCETLEVAQIKCWISSRDELPGEQWAQMIVRGMDESKIVVFILSAHSNNSAACARELALAHDKNKIIIPFQINDVVLSGELQYHLAGRQRIDAFTPPIERHLNKLVDAVSELLRKSLGEGAPVTPAVPSPEEPPPSVRVWTTTPHPAPPRVSFCRECGNLVTPDQRYCNECGAAIDKRMRERPATPAHATLAAPSESPPYGPATKPYGPQPRAAPAAAPSPPLRQQPYAPPSPPRRRFKKRYVLYGFVLLIFLAIVASAIASLSGKTVSQGGLTITLTSYKSNVPYTEIENGTPGNTYYLVNTTWAGTTYWNPSDRIKTVWVWSDGNVSTWSMSRAPTDVASANDQAGTYPVNTSWTFWNWAPTTSNTRPVEFQLRVPTSDGGTSTFTWSLT
jgi:hypothetical protein